MGKKTQERMNTMGKEAAGADRPLFINPLESERKHVDIRRMKRIANTQARKAQEAQRKAAEERHRRAAGMPPAPVKDGFTMARATGSATAIGKFKFKTSYKARRASAEMTLHKMATPRPRSVSLRSGRRSK